MGKIRKGAKCSVASCAALAIRSLSREEVESLGLKLADERRAYLCEPHYKEFKKKRRGSRQVEKWRWSA